MGFNQVHRYLKYKSNVDYGIILKDLCVIDVDSDEIATELEMMFPVLAYKVVSVTAC